MQPCIRSSSTFKADREQSTAMARAGAVAPAFVFLPWTVPGGLAKKSLLDDHAVSRHTLPIRLEPSVSCTNERVESRKAKQAQPYSFFAASRFSALNWSDARVPWGQCAAHAAGRGESCLAACRSGVHCLPRILGRTQTASSPCRSKASAYPTSQLQ
jgi:hypothetical protein